jgi:hypothetical protein
MRRRQAALFFFQQNILHIGTGGGARISSLGAVWGASARARGGNGTPIALSTKDFGREYNLLIPPYLIIIYHEK